MVDLNGTFVAEENAHLSIHNRGFSYGDALFETIRVIDGKIVFWEDHYFRLMASMRMMRMEIPMKFSPEHLEERILSLVEKNGLLQNSARVNIHVHRQSGGFYKPETRKIGYIIKAAPLKEQFYTIAEGDYPIELFKDHYVQSGILSTIKSNNRLVNVLGSIYAEENGYANCLLLNEKKSVVEALNGNLFLVKGKTLKTAALAEGCLNGIIRKKLIEIIRKTDYQIEETKISPFELQKSDELFITNVITGIRPITHYRKTKFDDKVSRVLFAKLNTLVRLGDAVLTAN